MSRAKDRPCQAPGAHHSDDRVLMYHGELTPWTVCGYHAYANTAWMVPA